MIVTKLKVTVIIFIFTYFGIFFVFVFWHNYCLYFVVQTFEKEPLEIKLDYTCALLIKVLKKAYEEYDPSLFILEIKEQNEWK